MSLYRRLCPCGKWFETTRKNVHWHSEACRRLKVRVVNRKLQNNRRRRAAKHGATGGHTEAEWREILRRQNFRCYYQQEELTPANWSRDHVIPITKGGTEDASNIVAACRKCNHAKGTLSIDEFREKLRAQGVEVLF